MPTIAAGTTATIRVASDGTLTVTPGTGGRVSLNARGSDGGQAIAPREIYSSLSVAASAGDVVVLEAINVDATYTAPVSVDATIEQTKVKSVLINGGSVYVRTAWTAALDILQRTSFALAPTTASNSVIDYIGEREIPIATLDTAVGISGAWAAGTVIATQVDATAPLKYNNVNMGMAHGCTAGHTITAVGHGKTTADIGAIWNGPSSRTFTILRIISVDSLLLISNNSGTSAQWAFYATSLSGQTLTHASGATNTASIVITADTTSTQIYPALNNRQVAVYINDETINADTIAVYTNCSLRIEERFGIVNPASAITYLQAAPGAARSYFDDSIYADVTVSNVDRWQSNGLISRDRATTFHSAVNLQTDGVVQQIPPTVGGGDVLKVYMPGVAPIAANDYRAGVDITASAVIWDAVTATWLDASNPPNRIAEIVSNTGVNKYGTVLGFSPVSRDSTRRKTTINTGSAGGFLSGASKKMYPLAFNTFKQPAAGETRRVLAYSHTYNAASTAATVETWLQDGNSVVVTVDFHQISTLTKVALPAEFNGCSARVLDSSGVRLLQNYVLDGEGLSLACDAAYGYAQVLLSKA